MSRKVSVIVDSVQSLGYSEDISRTQLKQSQNLFALMGLVILKYIRLSIVQEYEREAKLGLHYHHIVILSIF